MRFTPLPIAGAFRIEVDRLEDERGFFARTFCAYEFGRRGLVTEFVQHSVSFNHRRGTLRGLHYQAASHAETKLVRCTAGAAFDVTIDLRRNSPSFGRWHAETISAENGMQIYIPVGCAHGFQTLMDATALAYAITPAHVPEAGQGIAFDDPDLAIDWPLAAMIISDADRARPSFKEVEPFP